MYKCEDCKLIIEDYNDLAEDFGGGRICPCCSGDVEQVRHCITCEDYIPINEVFCDKCKMQLRKTVQEFMDTFTEEERKYINEIYDGEEL